VLEIGDLAVHDEEAYPSEEGLAAVAASADTAPARKPEPAVEPAAEP
jgi:Amt family ammonium transporter